MFIGVIDVKAFPLSVCARLIYIYLTFKQFGGCLHPECSRVISFDHHHYHHRAVRDATVGATVYVTKYPDASRAIVCWIKKKQGLARVALNFVQV